MRFIRELGEAAANTAAPTLLYFFAINAAAASNSETATLPEAAYASALALGTMVIAHCANQNDPLTLNSYLN